MTVSLVVAGSLSAAAPLSAASAAPKATLVSSYSLLYHVAGTTTADQVDDTREGEGLVFDDATSDTVTAAAGTASVATMANNVVVQGADGGSPLSRIKVRTSFNASTTTGDPEATGTPYADTWNVYIGDFTTTRTVMFDLDLDVTTSTNDPAQCTHVEVSLTGPEGVVYSRDLWVGSSWCRSDEENGSLSGNFSPGDYRLYIQLEGSTDASTTSTLMSGAVRADLQFGMAANCDNHPAFASTITGTSGDDVLCGSAGNDVINGRGGDDLILAGAGHDTVDGGAGDDVVYGTGGEDTIDGGDGRDALHGQEDNDAIRGGAGRDDLDAGTGNDVLSLGRGADTAAGNAGDDRFNACGGGVDSVSGGTGPDRATFDPGVDVVASIDDKRPC